MALHKNHTSEYVVMAEKKPKVIQSYYVESDDDDIEPVIIPRRIVQRKPSKDRRMKYVEATNADPEQGTEDANESNERGIKIRHTVNGEQIIVDDDDNILKIVRAEQTPTPTPPLVQRRHMRVNYRKPRTVYYETSDSRLIERPAKPVEPLRKKPQYKYVDDDSPRIVRKVIVDSRMNEQNFVYEKEKPKLGNARRIKIRKPVDEVVIDPEDYYESIEEQPEYVRVVERRPLFKEIIPKKESNTKYVMIRRKIDPEPTYTLVSPTSPMPTNRRVIYATQVPKKSPTKYVYAENDRRYHK